MKRPRILLADDHTLVVEGFRRLLEPEFEVISAVEDGRALLEAAPRLHPDIILLDISMPLLNGVDAARRLRKIVPQAKLIFVTMHADAAYVGEAFRAGGAGYLLKRSAAVELVTAIREVLKGRFYITPLVAREFLEPLAKLHVRPRVAGGLTTRQREVLQLVAEGRSNKEIATLLRVSVKAIEFHKSAVARVLGIHTTAELTKYAIEHGLIAT